VSAQVLWSQATHALKAADHGLVAVIDRAVLPGSTARTVLKPRTPTISHTSPRQLSPENSTPNRTGWPAGTNIVDADTPQLVVGTGLPSTEN
jgi:hypothetical protein